MPKIMTREEQEAVGDALAAAIYSDVMSAPFVALSNALTAKQVGVIVHGGGINVDAFEFDAECEGLHCKRLDGYTELYRVA